MRLAVVRNDMPLHRQSGLSRPPQSSVALFYPVCNWCTAAFARMASSSSHQRPVLFAQRCRATVQRSGVTISPWQISFVIRGNLSMRNTLPLLAKMIGVALKQSALMTGRVRRSFSGGADGERREGGAQSHRLCHKPLALFWASCV